MSKVLFAVNEFAFREDGFVLRSGNRWHIDIAWRLDCYGQLTLWHLDLNCWEVANKQFQEAYQAYLAELIVSK
jgi:hypothetical protein